MVQVFAMVQIGATPMLPNRIGSFARVVISVFITPPVAMDIKTARTAAMRITAETGARPMLPNKTSSSARVGISVLKTLIAVMVTLTARTSATRTRLTAQTGATQNLGSSVKCTV